MRLTLLGTGNAAGMPLHGCDCKCCIMIRDGTAQRRGPASAILEVGGKRYLIDAGLMDIADRYPAGSLHGIFLTHFHPDHVQGLFHLRWGKGESIPVYCPVDSTGCSDLFKNPGILEFLPQQKYTTFGLDSLRITPLPLIHSKPTFGYLFEAEGNRIGYLVDTKGIPPRVETVLSGSPLDLAIVDTCFSPEFEGRNHNNLTETLSIHKQIGSNKTVLTHIGHDLDLWLNDNRHTLPKNVVPGYDGYLAYPHNNE